MRTILTTGFLTVGIGLTSVWPQPAAAMAAWPDVVGPTMANTIERGIKVVADIRKAMMAIILMEGVAMQVNQVIDNLGGKINWVDYLQKLPQDAAVAQTQNLVAQLTRGGSFLTAPGTGGAGDTTAAAGDINARLETAAKRALQRYVQGSINTGGADLTAFTKGTTIDALTGQFNPFGGPNNATMAGFLSMTTDPNKTAAGLMTNVTAAVAAAEDMNRMLLSAEQTMAGYNTADPQFVAAMKKETFAAGLQLIGNVTSGSPGADTTSQIIKQFLPGLMRSMLVQDKNSLGKQMENLAKSTLADFFNSAAARPGAQNLRRF